MLFAAILFIFLLCADALAQSATFHQVGPLASDHLNHSAEDPSFGLGVPAYYQPIVVNARTSQTTVPLIGQVGSSSMPPRLSPYFPSHATPAKSLASVPFTYRTFDHGSRCFGGRLGTVQVASCIGLLGFDRPELNRLQNVVVHVMRHYTWREAVHVNHTCVRSLSCSSLFEKSVVERIALRPPN